MLAKRSKRVSQEVQDKAVEMRATGKTYQEIADECGISIHTVSRIVSRSVLNTALKDALGVDESTYAKILCMHALEVPRTHIAAELHLHTQTVASVLDRKDIRPALAWFRLRFMTLLEPAKEAIRKQIEKGDGDLALQLADKMGALKEKVEDERPQQVINIGWPTPPWAQPPALKSGNEKDDNNPAAP